MFRVRFARVSCPWLRFEEDTGTGRCRRRKPGNRNNQHSATTSAGNALGTCTLEASRAALGPLRVRREGVELAGGFHGLREEVGNVVSCTSRKGFDVVGSSRVDMNNCMRRLRANVWDARHEPGRRISGATHGWPVLSLTACALLAHAITEYGKPDCLWNAGSIAVFKIPIHTPPRCGPERKCCRRFCSNRSRGASRQSRRSAGSSASSHIRPD